VSLGKEVNFRLYGIVAEEERTSKAAEEEVPGQNAIIVVFYETIFVGPCYLVVPSNATDTMCFGVKRSMGVGEGSTYDESLFQGLDI
jgi:hypothetical protein